MKPPNLSAYLAVVLAALASAVLQPGHATAVEQEASRLVEQSWTAVADTDAVSDTGALHAEMHRP